MSANPAYCWRSRQPLARKLTAIVLVVVSVVLAVACAAFATYDVWTTRARLVRDAKILADVVGTNSTAALMFHDADAAGETLRAVSVEDHMVEARLYDRDGRPLATYTRNREDTSLPASIDMSRIANAATIFAGNSLRVLRPVVLGRETVGAIAVVSEGNELIARLTSFGAIVALVTFGGYWIGLFLSRLLSRATFQSIEQLMDVTRTVRDDGRYDIRAKRTTDDEIGELIDRFNGMLAEVQRRDQALIAHQENLEKVVDTRTAELRAANDDLVVARDRAVEASRSKSDFLANMSHEIRTPMNGIIGMTELVLDTALQDDQRECLLTVRSSADSLLTILNDILDFSKIESRKLELESIPFSIRDTLAEVLRPFALRADQKGLEVVADVHPDVPSAILGDPVRVKQILANLVGNAIKFTDKGHVVVSVFEEARAAGCTRLHVSVQDTGIGIPAEKHESIFEAFRQVDGSTTRRYGGTGLGLAIAATLVRLMGGRLWVESESGAGATFHFTIASDVADAPETAQRFTVPDGVRALVIDDNEVNRRLLVEQLLRWRFGAVAVADGKAAIALLMSAQREGLPFRLVLLDANMPDVDGFEVAAQISARSELAGATVMMLTSSGKYGDQSRCKELGIAAYLTKPIHAVDLHQAIGRALGLQAVDPLRPGTGVSDEMTSRTKGPARDVLLVEDNVVNQRVAMGLLTRRGHRVTVAHDGQQALDCLDARSFDVVLMDVQMPVMGGLEATKAIRQREAASGGHQRIVAMTAHAMNGDRERCLAAGMDGYLAKPVSPRMLFDVVEQSSPAVESRPVTAPAPPPTFNEAEFRARVDNDDALMTEVIRLFLDDCPKRLAAIRSAVETRDAVALRAAAHSLKGSAGNLSATGLFESARILERIAAESRMDAANAAWRTLSMEAANVMDALRRFETAPAA